jgi:hypothetical protein
MSSPVIKNEGVDDEELAKTEEELRPSQNWSEIKDPVDEETSPQSESIGD